MSRKELKRLIAQNKVIPFIGAGVSMAVLDKSGSNAFLSWKQLLEKFADKLEELELKAQATNVRSSLEVEKNYLSIADDIKDFFSNESFYYKALEKFFDIKRDTIDDKSLELAKAIWSLGLKLTITTNYDKVLHWASPNIADTKFWDIQSIHEQGSSLRDGIKTNTVWHIHGHIDNKKNIILTTDSYNKLYNESMNKEFKTAISTLKNHLAQKSFLFIGYSLEDKFFVDELEKVYNLFDNSSSEHYILLREGNELPEKLKSKIIPIYYEDYGQPLIELIQELGEEVDESNDNEEVISLKKLQSNDESKKTERLQVCIYTASPLNENIDYNFGKIKNTFTKYDIDLYHKILTEDELVESFDFDYSFIFTKTNKDKIIIEDEYFVRKSIELSELAELIDTKNTILFLDKEIKDSEYEIQKIESKNKIKRVLISFLHKKDFFNKGKFKEYSLNTELPELIDRKNLNSFVGRVTDLENIIKKILTVKEENKILTIKGSGGVGKTTIISKAVVEMADRGKFEEGIKFVQCEFIRDYEDFENKISHAFDMTNALEFKKQLKEQELYENRLIILDNVETLLCVNDTVEIKELIRFISDYATIVITSREILNERDYEEVYELHKLTTDEAEELFFELYPMNTPLNKNTKRLLRVSILENLLDNNPLAIKLITKNLIKGKSLESLKEELEESFFDITSEDIENIFDKESDINIERTQSLFQSINYSYRRLNDKEKLVLELLSLFPDGIHLENFKNFYKENKKSLLEDKKKDKKVQLNSFSERDITSLEDKSLLVINNGFVMLQSIVGRFSEFKFNQRDKADKKVYYEKAYDFNEFIILIISKSIENELKRYMRNAIFESNKNNFIKSMDYIYFLEKDDRKLRYIDRVVDSFAMQGSSNEQLLDKINYLKVNYVNEDKEKDFMDSIDMNLKYYYGNFDVIYEKIQKIFPINAILKNSLETSIDERFAQNILNIYLMEGYVYECSQFSIANNESIDISEVFQIGEFQVAKQILDKVIEKDFFEFAFQLAVGELDINELKRYVKSIFKTQHIDKVQSTYTLLKADSKSVDIKMIKKLIVVNPFTDGLKSLMFAMKKEDEDNRQLFENAIEKLFHIKYFHVEAILIYCRYLKDKENETYNDWFSKGKALAEKYHYRYIHHQFICLDSGVYTEYNEDEYPLPEALNFSKILKKLE